jgi:hypothetical protein
MTFITNFRYDQEEQIAGKYVAAPTLSGIIFLPFWPL